MRKLIKGIRGDGEEAGLGFFSLPFIIIIVLLMMNHDNDEKEKSEVREGVWLFQDDVLNLTWERDDGNLTYIIDDVENQTAFFISIGEDDDFVYYVHNGESGEFKSKEYYELAEEYNAEEYNAVRVSDGE